MKKIDKIEEIREWNDYLGLLYIFHAPMLEGVIKEEYKDEVSGISDQLFYEKYLKL